MKDGLASATRTRLGYQADLLDEADVARDVPREEQARRLARLRLGFVLKIRDHVLKIRDHVLKITDHVLKSVRAARG